MLFCAAQAPELFGRDQRYGVLPLYFSRALTRTDYAVARIGGLMLALLLVDLVPQLILFVGRVLVGERSGHGLADELPARPALHRPGAPHRRAARWDPCLIAAWTPRRAYATAGIIAVLIIPPVIVALVDSLSGGDVARWLVLLSPSDVLDGANAWIFGAFSENPVIAKSSLPGPAFAAAAIAMAVVSIGLTIRRYQKITV